MVVRSVKSIFHIFVIVAAIVCSSCASSKKSGFAFFNEKSESDCVAKGGKVAAYLMYQHVCVLPSTDKGKSCQNSTECQGICEPIDENRTEKVCDVPNEKVHDCDNVDTRNTVCDDGCINLYHLGTEVDPKTGGVCSATQSSIKLFNCRHHVENGKLIENGCND